MKQPRRPANDEMVRGFMDGYDPDCPEPGPNQSHSYRHGFAQGRYDTSKDYAPRNIEAVELEADKAMDKDEQANAGSVR
jgi:hypothetical protein